MPQIIKWFKENWGVKLETCIVCAKALGNTAFACSHCWHELNQNQRSFLIVRYDKIVKYFQENPDLTFFSEVVELESAFPHALESEVEGDIPTKKHLKITKQVEPKVEPKVEPEVEPKVEPEVEPEPIPTKPKKPKKPKKLTDKYLQRLSRFDRKIFSSLEKEEARQHILPSRTIDPRYICVLFYKLVYLQNKKFNNPYQKRVFFRLKNTVESKLAQALFDYLALCSFGEMRHAVNKMKDYKTRSKHIRLGERDEALQQAMRFDPYSILQAGLKLFGGYTWDGSYGGLSWWKICSVASKYGEVPNEIFIDLVWDVRHNGGRMFDRSAIFLNEMSLREFLDWKVDNSESDWKNLKFEELFLPPYGQNLEEAMKAVLAYKPIKWGFLSLEYIVERKIPLQEEEEEQPIPEEPIEEQSTEEESEIITVPVKSPNIIAEAINQQLWEEAKETSRKEKHA